MVNNPLFRNKTRCWFSIFDPIKSIVMPTEDSFEEDELFIFLFNKAHSEYPSSNIQVFVNTYDGRLIGWMGESLDKYLERLT